MNCLYAFEGICISQSFRPVNDKPGVAAIQRRSRRHQRLRPARLRKAAVQQGTEHACARLKFGVCNQARGFPVRLAAVTICLTLGLPSGFAEAQTVQPNASPPNSTTGRTPPETKGQLQPQGWTGPVDTSSGGAPPESPQGQSPPGMQAAPEGSSKTVVKPQ
jgi:hypothetical protein